MARIICRKNGQIIAVNVNGDATVRNITKVRELFESLTKSGQTECRVDLSAMSEIDLSFFQLLVSFRKTMLRDKKIIVFEPLPSDHPFPIFARGMGIDTTDFFMGGDRHGI